jgi:hypothetical protein
VRPEGLGKLKKFIHFIGTRDLPACSIESKLPRATTKFIASNNTLVTVSVAKWSEFLATDPKVLFRLPALPDFLRSSGPGTGYTQPRECK